MTTFFFSLPSTARIDGVRGAMRPPAPNYSNCILLFCSWHFAASQHATGDSTLKTRITRPTIIARRPKSKSQSITVHNASKQEIHVWLLLTTDST